MCRLALGGGRYGLRGLTLRRRRHGMCRLALGGGRYGLRGLALRRRRHGMRRLALGGGRHGLRGLALRRRRLRLCRLALGRGRMCAGGRLTLRGRWTCAGGRLTLGRMLLPGRRLAGGLLLLCGRMRRLAGRLALRRVARRWNLGPLRLTRGRLGTCRRWWRGRGLVGRLLRLASGRRRLLLRLLLLFGALPILVVFRGGRRLRNDQAVPGFRVRHWPEGNQNAGSEQRNLRSCHGAPLA